VVSEDTGAPIRDVTVTLEDASGFTWVSTTDDQGAFEFRDLPLATLALRIKRNGFVTVSTTASSQTLQDRLTVDYGTLRLIRGGVIAGRVVDIYGDPVVDMPILAYRLAYPSPGDRRIEQVGLVSTNDLGEYRLFGLTPGTYFVSAGLGRGFASAFYGATTVPADAQPVIVRPGGLALGIDIPLRPTMLAQLSGIIVDASGQPGSDSFVILSPARVDGSGVFAPVRVETDDEGRFRFRDLVSGEYQLDVIAFASAGAIATAGSATPAPGRVAPEFASTTVVVTGDPGDVLVRTRRGSQMHGRVTIDGARPSPAAVAGMKVTTLPILLAGSAAEVDVLRATEVSADGTFALTGLSGTRSIGVSGGRPGLTLQRVTLNGADVTDDGVPFGRGSAEDLEIGLTSTLSIVRGQVRDADGKLASAYVIVFSDDRRLWTKVRSRHIAYASAEPDGQFVMSALPPGQYLAVALQYLERNQRANPDLLESLRAHAVTFALAEGETKTLTLARR